MDNNEISDEVMDYILNKQKNIDSTLSTYLDDRFHTPLSGEDTPTRLEEHTMGNMDTLMQYKEIELDARKTDPNFWHSNNKDM